MTPADAWALDAFLRRQVGNLRPGYQLIRVGFERQGKTIRGSFARPPATRADLGQPQWIHVTSAAADFAAFREAYEV